ncbi:hypothetical protein GN956_G26826, partial [Arapaima gigas]
KPLSHDAHFVSHNRLKAPCCRRRTAVDYSKVCRLCAPAAPSRPAARTALGSSATFADGAATEAALLKGQRRLERSAPSWVNILVVFDHSTTEHHW